LKNYMYSEMIPGQEQLVADVVWEVFEEFVAPGYSHEGIETSRNFIQVNEIRKATDSGRMFVICCWARKIMAGVIAMGDGNHICLLFIKKDYHRQGIAKELLNRAINKCKKIKPDLTEITVNSSPYGHQYYRRHGPGFVSQEGRGTAHAQAPQHACYRAVLAV
jgi:GNAT superfamily N-acetyltransferase